MKLDIRRAAISGVAIAAVVVIIILAAAAALVLVPQLQAHGSTQTTQTNIGTITLSIYANYTDGSSTLIKSVEGNFVPNSAIAINGSTKALTGFYIKVTDSLTLSGLVAQAPTVSVTQGGKSGIFTVVPHDSIVPTSVPAAYDLPASELSGSGTLGFSVTVSAVAGTKSYTAATPTIEVGYGPTNSTTAITTTNTGVVTSQTSAPTTTASTVTSVTIGTTTTVLTIGSSTTTATVSGVGVTTTGTVQVLAYPYGLPETYTSGDGHTWTLDTCDAALNWYNTNTPGGPISACSHLTSIYSISPTVTYVSSANAGTYTINGASCSISVPNSPGTMSQCWQNFIENTPGSTSCSTSTGACVGYGDYMPTGDYGS